MRLQEEAGHAVAPFAMHDDRNEPTPWSEYFVSNLDTRAVAPGFGALRQFGRAFWSVEAEKKFGRLLDVFRPDIVHAHNLYTQLSPSPLAVAKQRDIPVIMTVHDYALISANYSLWNKTRSMDFKKLRIWPTANTKYIKNSFTATLLLELILKFHHAIKAYDGCIVHYTTYSDFVKEVMITAGFPSDKISVVGSFAEPLMSPQLSGHPPIHGGKEGGEGRRAGRGSESGSILFAGRLESYKGAHILLESLRYLPSDTRIIIAGVGPEESRLKAMVRGDDRVAFLGFVPGDELWRLMAQAAVVVVPSIWAEPYGLVALEAMCQGTPVIVANSGGLPEIVGGSKGGIIVPPGDAKALAKAINKIIGDDKLQLSMGKAAFLRAKEVGNPQAHLAKIMEIYSRWG